MRCDTGAITDSGAASDATKSELADTPGTLLLDHFAGLAANGQPLPAAKFSAAGSLQGGKLSQPGQMKALRCRLGRPTLHKSRWVEHRVAGAASPKRTIAGVFEPRTSVDHLEHFGAGVEQMQLAAVDAADLTGRAKC